MAKLGINTGIIPDDGNGDSLLDGAIKINSNFDEIYTYFGDGTNLTFTGGGESYWVQSIAGIHTLSSVGIGTTNPTEELTVFGDARVTGILTVGTASITLNGTTNTINVGSGVTIDGNSGIISATSIVLGGSPITGSGVTSITAGSGISVDQSTGNVTISATGGSGGESYWSQTTAGIHTLSNVGIGTTNPTSALTVKGNTSLETLNVSGVSTFTGNVSFGSSALFGYNKIIFGSGNSLEIGHSGGGAQIYNFGGGKLALQSSDEIEFRTPTGFYARFTENYGALLYDNNNQIRLQTLGAGVTITGTTFTDQLSVSGVSTLSSNVSVGGTISIDGGVTLTTNNATIVGTSGTAGEIKQIGGAPFYYDGSAWREFVLSSGTPVTVPADTEWDNVVFRATFDDDFTDAKFGATPVYVSAGSSIVGAAVTIGTGAYRNLGGIGGVAGAGVSYAYRSEYDFTGSWTIEFWINHDTNPLSGYYTSIISQLSSTDPSGNWTFGYGSNGVTISYIWANENGTNTTIFQVSDTTFSNNYRDKWVHYALVREGDNGSIHFYVNGVESSLTINDAFIDSNILHINGAGLVFGAGFGQSVPIINTNTWNSYSLDAIFDDVRISCGLGTAGQRYNSIGISTYATFTPPTTELPITGTLSSVVNPPGDKYGEITLGGSPTWRGTSGVTVSQQSSGNYRVSFASSYTNANDYYVLSQGMDQGFASYVGIGRSTTHVDLAINKQSDDTAVNTGSLSVQIKNHI